MGSGILVLNQPGVYVVDDDGNLALVKDTETVTPGDQPVLPVAGVDGTTARTLRVDSGGRAKVQADALPLPAGASTEAKLEAVRALLASLDGKDFATQTTLATLATEAKLEAVRVLLSSIDGKDFATQTTLAAQALDIAALLVNSADIETILTSIRDAAGIKKIADELPAGTQEIGAVKQGTKAVGADAWPGVLYDAAGNAITSITDTEDPAEKRLQTESRLAPGSVVNIGTGVPADPGDLVISYLTDTGGGYDMLVNGSSTPVAFTFSPPIGETVSVQEILVIFTADDFSFDGASFGPNSALSNGIKVETTLDGTTTEIFNILQNEDYLRIPGRVPLVNNTGPKDVLGASFQFGGLLKLVQADGDNVTITVRDNLTSVKLKYLTATLFGATV